MLFPALQKNLGQLSTPRKAPLEPHCRFFKGTAPRGDEQRTRVHGESGDEASLRYGPSGVTPGRPLTLRCNITGTVQASLICAPLRVTCLLTAEPRR